MRNILTKMAKRVFEYSDEEWDKLSYGEMKEAVKGLSHKEFCAFMDDVCKRTSYVLKQSDHEYRHGT
jgi:hypothetical protein